MRVHISLCMAAISCVRQTEGLVHSQLALWEVNGVPSFSKASLTLLFLQGGPQFKGVVGLRLDSYIVCYIPIALHDACTVWA